MADGTNKKLIVSTVVFPALIAEMARTEDSKMKLILAGVIAVLVVVFLGCQLTLDIIDRKNLTGTTNKEQ